LTFLIEARDVYSNLITTSIADIFTVDLTLLNAGTTISVLPAPVSNNNGTYTVNYQFTTSDTYTLLVQNTLTDIDSMPITGIKVDVAIA
jgi:hypothetical protein